MKELIHKTLLVGLVMFLFIAGAFFANFMAELLGLKTWLSEANAIVLAKKVDFIQLSQRDALSFVIKYGIIFLLVAQFLKYSRLGLSIKSIGLTANDQSLSYLLKAGLLIFCVAGIIPKILFYLWPTGIVGQGPAHWQVLYQPWSSQFWIYMLVSSIILPPILEEIYFRGFAQSALETRFSAGWAIVLVAVIFTLFHTQYFQWSIISVSMIFSLLFSALLLGYARYHTGSLIPGIFAHALANIPVIGIPALVLVVIMILGLIWQKDTLIRHTKSFIMLINPPASHTESGLI